VENLLDTDPPLYPNWQQANTTRRSMDVLGRRYLLAFQYNF
jgi:hypothetical protein